MDASGENEDKADKKLVVKAQVTMMSIDILIIKNRTATTSVTCVLMLLVTQEIQQTVSIAYRGQ